MHIEMGVNAENDFGLYLLFAHGPLSSMESVRIANPIAGQDTHGAENKAPIRSQTSGPATHGERPTSADRSTQRQLGQSQHPSDRAGRSSHRRLSVPTVAFLLMLHSMP